MKNRFSWSIVLLGVGAVILLSLPFLIHPNATFSGTDDQAAAVVGELRPGFTPWFSLPWTLPKGEMQTLFFSLQAALGAGIIGYYLGYKNGLRKNPLKQAQKIIFEK